MGGGVLKNCVSTKRGTILQHFLECSFWSTRTSFFASKRSVARPLSQTSPDFFCSRSYSCNTAHFLGRFANSRYLSSAQSKLLNSFDFYLTFIMKRHASFGEHYLKHTEMRSNYFL